MTTFELENGGIGEMSFTWAGHGEPVSLPGGMVVYGSKGCLSGNTLYRDGREPVAVADLFRARGDDGRATKVAPTGTGRQLCRWLLRLPHGHRAQGATGSEWRRGRPRRGVRFRDHRVVVCQPSVLLDDVLSGKVRAAQRDIDDYYGLT